MPEQHRLAEKLAYSRRASMTVSVQFLFDRPQSEIASLIQNRLAQCTSAFLVTGFMTDDGVKAIAGPIRSSPGKLACLVVGAGTWSAFNALDTLLSAGVSPNALHVHLGLARPSGGHKNPFHRYRPMLHSKVYMFDLGGGTAVAFVGSHNLTGFALRGLNGEAGVLLEGPTDAPEMVAVRKHIATAATQAVAYDPGMKEAYTWWTLQFFNGLQAEMSIPSDANKSRTIVVIAACMASPLPRTGEIVYFEMPQAIPMQSLQPEVHIYLFATLPASPATALAALSSAMIQLSCKIEGLETTGGGREMRADWYADNRHNPEMRSAPSPFRPRPASGMQQISVRVQGGLSAAYEYLFDEGKIDWTPVYDEDQAYPAVELIQDQAIGLARSRSGRDTLSDVPWQRVRGLERSMGLPRLSFSQGYQQALLESAPEAETFILFSLRRRTLAERVHRR